MIDTSDDAIEADLERAARGGPAAATWIAWAQVRATLATRTAGPASEASGRPAFLTPPTEATSPDIKIAFGPFGDSYAVPATAAWEDRVTAAARMLGTSPDLLGSLFPKDGPGFGVELGKVHFTERQWQAVQVYAKRRDASEPDLVPPAEPDFELDIEHDGIELEHLEAEDAIDADFFADERKARDR